MATDGQKRLEERVERAAAAALAEQSVVAPVDVLLGLGWLAPRRADEWRQGRVEHLESAVDAGVAKVAAAMALLRGWAQAQGLTPGEIDYVARSRDRRPPRFGESGDPASEHAFRTHWFSPELSERERERLAERLSRPPDLVVVSPLDDWTCTTCGGTGGLLIMEGRGHCA